MPKVYKRVSVIFSVVKTTIYPDYFTRFKVQNFTQLTIDYVTEQTSNTTINEINTYSLELDPATTAYTAYQVVIAKATSRATVGWAT